jgi:topoisomerase-4 subunit A
VQSLNYRSGDKYLDSAKGRSTQPGYILDTTGRVYNVTTHDLSSARSQGEPLTGRLKPPAGSLFSHVFGGQPEDWYLLASNMGYGFRVQLKDLQSKNKAGKAAISLSAGAKALAPTLINNDSDLVAVVTLQGRLLIFPVLELPALSKGKGNKVIQIKPADFASDKDAVVSLCTLNKTGMLKIFSGKRHLTLKAEDIEAYSGNRAKRGSSLPRGFQRVDAIESFSVDAE